MLVPAMRPVRYADDYAELIQQAMMTVDKEALHNSMTPMIFSSMFDDLCHPILTFGNGGSAAIAEHVAADLIKCIKSDCSWMNPWVISLVSNKSLLTCIANDYDYEDVFSKQIEWCSAEHALVLGISSSGNSNNIVKAFKAATKKNYESIALVGFDGGTVLKENLADCIIHVKSDNYGVVEDCHSMIMHSIAQDIRINNCDNPSTLRL